MFSNALFDQDCCLKNLFFSLLSFRFILVGSAILDRWLGNHFGASESTIEFWSSFICSFREAGIGAISQTFGLMFGSGSDTNIDLDLEMQGLELEQQNMWFTQYAAQSGSQEIQQSIALDYEAQTELLSENMEFIEQRLAKQKKKTGLRSLISLGRIPDVINLILSGPSFLVGGAGLASFTLISDFAQDLVADIIPERLQAVRALEYFRNFKHALDPSIKKQSGTVSTQSVPQIKDVSNMRGIFPSGVVSFDQSLLFAEKVLQAKHDIAKVDTISSSKEIVDQLEDQHATPIEDRQMYTMSPNEGIPITADEVYKWGDYVTGFSIVDLTKEDSQDTQFRKSLYEAHMVFSTKGMDTDRSKTVIFKYGNQFLETGLAYQDKDKNWNTIDSTTKTLELYDKIDYFFDPNTDGWMTDTNQQIEVVYLEDLSPSDMDIYLKQKRMAGDLSEKMVSLDLMYLTEQEISDFYYDDFKNYLKNNPQIIINEETAPIYRKCFEVVKAITISMKTTLDGFDATDSNLIANTKKMLKDHWHAVFTSDSVLKQFSDIGLKFTYQKYVDGLFDVIFKDRFTRIQDENDLQDFIDKFEHVLNLVVLDEILRKAGIDDPKLTDYKKFSLKLEEIIDNQNTVNKLHKRFLTSFGRNKFLTSLTECFLCDPHFAYNAKHLTLNSKEYYYGYIAEQNFIFNRLRSIVVNLFKDSVSKLFDTQRRDLETKIYSSVSYEPGKSDYSNIFDLDYNKIKFYGDESRRHFDGAGILDLLTLSVSTAIKSTIFESLVQADERSRFKKSGLVDGLCHDGISAMLADVIKDLVGNKPVKQKRLVRLVGPFIVNDGLETLANVEKMMKQFYQTNVLKMGDKLPSHEVFLNRLVKRINSELKNKFIASDTVLKSEIKNLMSDSQFQKLVITDAVVSGFGGKSYFYKFLTGDDHNLAFLQLTNFLTEDVNFDKIIFEENGQFRLNLVYEYNPHFRTEKTLSLSDFPSHKVFTLDLRSSDGVKEISDDTDLQRLFNRKDSQGLVVCRHINYPDSIILVPSDRISDLEDTGIQIGYKYKGVIYYSYACDNSGERLISKLDFSNQGFKIRLGSKWVDNFYPLDQSIEDGKMIGYETTFYAAYFFGTGRDLKSFRTALQDTTVILEHIEPYRDPLHNTQFRRESSKKQITSLGSKTDYNFIDLSDLGNNERNLVGTIKNILDQFQQGFVYLPSKHKTYNYESISELVVSKDFFNQEGVDIEAMWNELNPSIEQLAALSTKLVGYSRQRQFYKTLHDILMAYTGSNELINDYINIPGRSQVTFESQYSSKFTKDEFYAIKDMEDILPKIFSYKFYTFMKLGLINLYTEQGSIKFQPLAFHSSLLKDIMNQRRIKGISANQFLPYKDRSFSDDFNRIFITVIIFGHLTQIAVIGEGEKVIYTKAPTNDLSGLIQDNVYKHPLNPNNYPNDYGVDVSSFLAQYYSDGINQDLRIKKNIKGKTAIMKGFASLLTDTMNPNIIRLAGQQLGIDELRDNADIWSEKYTLYSFYQIFNSLLNPMKADENRDYQDPTLRLARIYSGSEQATSYRISKDRSLPFWASNEFGRLQLTYPTLTQYFGNDFFTIQPALYYRHFNIWKTGSKDLSLNHLLTELDFKHKSQHLYQNLKDILSQNYKDNEEITATFHIETMSGFSEESTIDQVIKEKFSDLIEEDKNSLKFTIRKQGDNILNEAEFDAFILSITFYLVMFNAFVFIGDEASSYTLFASQRKIYNNDYLVGLDSARKMPSYVKLSQTGEQIYNTWQTQWNQDDGRPVWNIEDCWPIYLLDDARGLIDFFERAYQIAITPLGN
jgi:hypothetical protein